MGSHFTFSCFKLFLLCLSVCVSGLLCMSWCIHCGGQPVEVGSLLLPCRSQRLNLGPQDWQVSFWPPFLHVSVHLAQITLAFPMNLVDCSLSWLRWSVGAPHSWHLCPPNTSIWNWRCSRSPDPENRARYSGATLDMGAGGCKARTVGTGTRVSQLFSTQH